ncbi:MAG: TonB-dependent receptor [Bacteroidota bacterium]
MNCCYKLWLILLITAVLFGRQILAQEATPEQVQASTSKMVEKPFEPSSNIVLGPISIRLVNEPLISAIKKVAEIVRLRPVLDYDLIKSDKKINLTLNVTTLPEALDQILEGIDVQYSITESGLLIFRQDEKLPSPPGTVQGVVTDAVNSEELIGVNVVVMGTSLGTATDVEGQFRIVGIPARAFSMKISCIGYESQVIKVDFSKTKDITLNIHLKPAVLQGEEVVVTAQASGQNAAINEQLSSQNIENVVSAARIQALPDANAAESIGRLPGVSLTRFGGEATQIVIRGLEPKYNVITIDGVEIPSTGSPTNSTDRNTIDASINNRGTDLSMISSTMLRGIEVTKTATPDRDAAVLGGTVNFDIREAKASSTGAPTVFILAQGGYNNLSNLYNDYKFVGSVEQRFFDDKFGVFAQAIAERVNRTSDGLNVNYYIPNKPQPDITAISNIQPSYNQVMRQRYDGTLVLDYQMPEGRISLMNLLSNGKTTSENYSQYYDVTGNTLKYYTTSTPNTLNVITNLLHFEQRLFTVKMDAKLSHSYSENISPNSWQIGFTQQGSTNTATLPYNYSPKQISQYEYGKTNFDTLDIDNNSWWQSFSKQRDITGSVDLERAFTISDFLSATLKIGGMFKYTTRYYNYDGGGGLLVGSIAWPVHKLILQHFPWLMQAPYNLNANGTQEIPIVPFLNRNFRFGDFLNGDYAMNCGTNIGLLSQIMDISKDYGYSLKSSVSGGSNPFVPDVYGSLANDYSGNERRYAEYALATINIGSQITLVPGVRFQALQTSYRANRFYNASAANPYPGTLTHIDTTFTEFHGYWLPDASLKYDPFTWLSIRAAYSNTLAYPDYRAIIPIIDVFSASANWNNVELKPARSHNYDFQISIYSNEIGLLAVSPFLKRIDDLIFSQSSYISDPSKYVGLPSYTKAFALTTYINNPNRVDVYGVESEWQTHFWYLPKPFDGLVMNVNYTHIFSGAKYPYTYYSNSGFPFYKSIYVDTSYSDRLIDQPNDIVNLSVGYDYNSFSILVSVISQTNIFNSTNFYNSLRSDKSKYLRWDIAGKQGLPWFGLEVFFDVNNINNESDTYVIRGSGFPNSMSDYGLTADLGVRWKL